MHKELTNLMPPERQRALLRDYYFRLTAVFLIFVVGLVLAAAVLLVPIYVFLTKSVGAKKTHLADINSSLSLSDEVALSAQLTTLSQNAAALSSLTQAPSASGIISKVLSLSRPGIVLTGFEYSSADKNNLLKISGRAVTRDALRNYQLAIEGSAFAHAVDLPVSAYAKDTDIAFTITVTLAP